MSDVNDTLDRLCQPDAAEWLESGAALRPVRHLAIAYDNATLTIDAQAKTIAALRGKLAGAELALLNQSHRLAMSVTAFDGVPDEDEAYCQSSRRAGAL
jgi:hypothetical protein